MCYIEEANLPQNVCKVCECLFCKTEIIMSIMFIVAHVYITKTRPCNIQGFFTAVKRKQNLIKKNVLIFAQNIDCGYTFEPPQ